MNATMLNRRNIALSHGAFLTVAGVWPVVGMRTFQLVTGPKTDTWLVKTVGSLIAVVGVRVMDDARRGRVRGDTAWLGIGVAAVLGVISCFYSLKRRISRIYLLDSLAEGAWIVLWCAALLRDRERHARKAAS